MTREDLDEVTDIDREAFPTQWPPADYSYEFKNKMAHYMVACDSGTIVEHSRAASSGGPGWMGRLFGRRPVPVAGERPGQHYIVGFVGFWIMAGEAHITSIAVRTEFRRRRIGEQLLVATIELARELGADVVTLEVRASNTSAQNLYTKYGFKRVGERKAYYLDRGPSGSSREDAFIMTNSDIKVPGFQERLWRLKQSLETR
jgi:ribosomal-protein-alanine N-acetyltransferase